MTETLDRGIDTLRGGFGGTVLEPSNAGYDDARSLWNGMIDKRPALIARCTDVVDVVRAVRFARDHDLEIAVRGGGHSFAGASTCDGGIVIDLSPMRQVTVDPTARTAVVGGGATGADLDAATQAHGLAVTAGTISHTGIGGLTLGGGIGWLAPMLGPACANVVAADLVTADGRQLRLSAEENPDLFWAIRGGGGNFGIVTSFTFRLHPVGPEVQFGALLWHADDGAEALRTVVDAIDGLPHTTGALLAGLNAPPMPFVPEEHVGKLCYALLLAGFGGSVEHQRVLGALKAAGPRPMADAAMSMPYTALQQVLDDAAPWGICGYEKALYLDEVNDDAIGAITEMLPKKTSPLSFTPSFPVYGAVTEQHEDTAFGVSGAETMVFNIAALGMEPAATEADIPWARDYYERMLPFASSNATYVNFLGEDDQERVKASYGTKYARLAAIKATYDPDNIFHRNANIKPAS